MPRQRWATKEQEVWLEERNPAFLLANQKKAAAKDFFPLVVQEFRDKWPVPPVTQEEINAAGSLEVATRGKKNKYDKVYPLLFRVRERLTIINSGLHLGFITRHGHLVMVA